MASRTRTLLQNRLVLPASLVAVVGLGGAVIFGTNGASSASTPAQAAQPAPPVQPAPVVGGAPSTNATPQDPLGVGAGGGVGANNFNVNTGLPPGIGSPQYLGGRKNSGGANSNVRVYRKVHGHRQLVAYGNNAIIYTNPPAGYIPVGQQLFAQNCASCHGDQAQGSAIAPALVGVGPATVDFWVSTGRMPAVNTAAVQANAKPPRLNNLQSLQIAAYVNSLEPAVPFVPTPNVNQGNVSVGASLFALNCAACHTITGGGDALAEGTSAPSLRGVTPRQIAEAIRTGPANMPRFTGNLTDNQVRDVVAYVANYIQHPVNPGGAGLGGLGPVAEGFVALLIGVGIFVLICFWIGDRA